MNSVQKEHTLQWIIGWADLYAQDDPVGIKFLKVIDLVTPAELYDEYVIDFKTFHFAVSAKPVSDTTFKRVWDFWIKEYKIRVREKKNVTTKCPGKP